MLILSATYKELINSFSSVPIESGGIIGISDNVINRFYFDSNNHNNEHYSPNIDKLNKVIEEWYFDGAYFAGIVHSHYNDCRFLSKADIEYARNILSECELSEVFFPIVTYNNDSVIITPYLITITDVKREELIILN